jgi:hypothetical protein
MHHRATLQARSLKELSHTNSNFTQVPVTKPPLAFCVNIANSSSPYWRFAHTRL